MANITKTPTTRSGKTTITKKPPRSPATTTRKSSTRARATDMNPEIRYQMIAEAAYLRAEQRGFDGGDPLEDWLIAEREVDQLLAERATQVTQ